MDRGHAVEQGRHEELLSAGAAADIGEGLGTMAPLFGRVLAMC